MDHTALGWLTFGGGALTTGAGFAAFLPGLALGAVAAGFALLFAMLLASACSHSQAAQVLGGRLHVGLRLTGPAQGFHRAACKRSGSKQRAQADDCPDSLHPDTCLQSFSNP